jgi:hypothetical protein
MRQNSRIWVSVLVSFGIAVFLATACVRAQPSLTDFNQAYESAVAKARQDCAALWSNHAFDPFRDKVSFSDDKPTFSMLKNTEKLLPKDRPIADLAIKTLEQCRKAYEPVYSMLPPQIANLLHGVERRQDATIAELYRGKITFGDYNVAMNRMSGELAAAVAGLSQPPPAPAGPKEIIAIPPQPAQHVIPTSSETRLALVIGNSNYINLPKLSNPANDARAIAESLKKLGYRTRLVLDASEQIIRREVRQFAGDSEKADVALVFYAGHGAQVNGSNYVIPVDIDIPRTEVDIQLSSLSY